MHEFVIRMVIISVQNAYNQGDVLQVLTKDGQEAEVPSIILVIPAPDPESFRAAHR